MIWNDEKIAEWAAAGGITPFDPKLVNPASLDLTLGASLRRLFWPGPSFITKATSPSDIWMDPISVRGYELEPGECILCHSEEYITMPDDAAGMLISKSSSGRLLFEHFHSGWFDPGFHGQATFEFKNEGKSHLILSPGEAWVQLVLVQMIAPPKRSYRETGRYNGQVGPEAHRVEKGPQ